jgi:spore coat protein A
MKKRGILFSALFLLSLMAGFALAAQSPQVPLAGAAIPQFAQPLPLLSVAPGGTMTTVSGNTPLTIRMCEFKAKMLPPTFVPPAPSTYAGYTWVWGYLPDPTGTSTCADLINLYDVPDGSGILDTYIGPVIVNARAIPPAKSPTALTFVNDLPTGVSTQVLAWQYSTDQTLHWADPLNNELNDCNMKVATGGFEFPAGSGVFQNYPPFGDPCAQNYVGPVPAVVHLHGGEVPPELDGGPDAWVTSNGIKGHGYYSFAGAPANAATYKYPNTQEASPIWFHDHALGITRLNVYAGLAGAYLITDPDLSLPTGLHPAGLDRNGSVEYTVPIVLQDRMFDADGQLFFQADSAGNLLWATNPQHPYWSPEFVGDTIVVNGKAWPYLNVEPKRYRFWFINGSNARTYEMFLIDPLGVAIPPRMWVIATDGGYLDAPVMVKKLVMMPGERYEVIVDFAGVAPGTNLVLKNTAKTPFPGGATPQGATLGQIMQFRVGACTSGLCGAADTSFNPVGATLRPAVNKIVRLPGAPGGPAISTQNVQVTRALTLNEVMGMPQIVPDPVTGIPTAYPGGPLEILVNNTKWSGESDRNLAPNYQDFTQITVNGITTYYSETPKEGDTEIWEIINLTADAHPIHLHLVQFQLIDRQSFNVNAYSAAYNAAFPASTVDPACIGGVFCPGFGPPLNYNPSNASGGKYGGNPNVAAVGKNGKPLYLSGKAAPPDPNEAGWKDTVIMYPGQVTRIAVRWAPTDLPVQTTGNLASLYYPFDPSNFHGHGYVWHCHIIDHEDNEMMRPDLVILNPAAPAAGSRPLVRGVDY